MAFGIERLIAEGVYSAAYPLHDVGNRLNIHRWIDNIKPFTCVTFI